jgi:hypothetical protein
MSTGDILFIVVIIAIVAALVIWVVTISARAKRMSTASDAFLAAQLQELAANPPPATSIGLQASGERSESVMTAARNSANPKAGASSTKEARLTELAELHSKSLISDDELAAARAKILAE